MQALAELIIQESSVKHSEHQQEFMVKETRQRKRMVRFHPVLIATAAAMAHSCAGVTREARPIANKGFSVRGKTES